MNHGAPDECPRSIELLSRSDSRLLIVDMQVKLMPAIPVASDVVGRCRMLIRGAGVLRMPVDATEQYPEGLGGTVPEIAELLGDVSSKRRFSCAEVLKWENAAASADVRHKIVVAGIEAHVCVQQTALDLMSLGYRVYIPADAVASRGKLDWKIALERMASCGAVITTAESVLFEWCETSAADEFSQISALIKEG